MAYPTFGGSSAALKGCATRKEAIRGVLGQAPRSRLAGDPKRGQGRSHKAGASVAPLHVHSWFSFTFTSITGEPPITKDQTPFWEGSSCRGE